MQGLEFAPFHHGGGPRRSPPCRLCIGYVNISRRLVDVPCPSPKTPPFSQSPSLSRPCLVFRETAGVGNCNSMRGRVPQLGRQHSLASLSSVLTHSLASRSLFSAAVSSSSRSLSSSLVSPCGLPIGAATNCKMGGISGMSAEKRRPCRVTHTSSRSKASCSPSSKRRRRPARPWMMVVVKEGKGGGGR